MEPTKNNSYKNCLFSTSHQLNPKLLAEINPYLTENELKKLPMACQGRSCSRIRILEPKNVLIRAAIDENQLKNLGDRINKMQSARKITKKYHYKHLKIPKANLIGNHLIEKLLPCMKGGLFGTMNYYIQNYGFFDKAVAEFTQFLMKTTLNDIVGSNRWMKSNWPNGMPRYDNILVYEQEKNGITKYRIGLIDLETFQDEPNEINHVFHAAKKAILLFPYQYDIILESSQKEYEFNKCQLQALKIYHDEALMSIKRVYTKHRDFLVLTSDSFTQFLNSHEEKNQMIEELSKSILFLDQVNRDNFWYRVESKDINFYKNELSDGKTLCSVVVKLKLLGENTLKTLEYLKTNAFDSSLYKICKSIKYKISNSQNRSSIPDYYLMARRQLVFVKTISQELFNFKRKIDLKPYTFSAKLISEREEQDVVEIDSFFTDMIIKSEFEEGLHVLAVQTLLLKSFEKKGLIAGIFSDDKCTTIFF